METTSLASSSTASLKHARRPARRRALVGLALAATTTLGTLAVGVDVASARSDSIGCSSFYCGAGGNHNESVGRDA